MTECENIICKDFLNDLVSESEKSCNEYKLIMKAIDRDTTHTSYYPGQKITNLWGTEGTVVECKQDYVIVTWLNKETNTYITSKWEFYNIKE